MNMKDFSLEGKVAWVTGASYGIGFAIASAVASLSDGRQSCAYTPMHSTSEINRAKYFFI